MELLQRLRDPFKVTPQDAAEAADEIERLRDAIKVQANAVQSLQESETTEINRLRKTEREAHIAIETLDSERKANAILTDDIDRLKKDLARITNFSIEQADEIERLQEEHHDVRILNEQYFNKNEILIDEIERLKKVNEKLIEAISDFHIAIHNAVFAFDKELDGILKQDVSQMTRMHDSHAQMSDDKGQR